MFNAARKFTTRITISIHQARLQKRLNSHLASINKTTSKALVYRLTSDDPFLNLSIEHYIFIHAPAHAKVLLFYVNRPCIVIGRNQNPWLEINLQLLRSTHASSPPSSSSGNNVSDADQGLIGSLKERGLSDVDYVRRRSGGGTVFHDTGNVNWGVICDVADFRRDKHAEMVVRALSSRNGISNVRVNERHDIVLDLPEQDGDGEGARVRKVSGSAYKLARGRALHHGTALCDSPNLDVISAFLKSPARSVITAKGVESVRSPIANLGLDPVAFMDSVEDELRDIYALSKQQDATIELGRDCLDLQEVRDGYEELKSEEWRYLQTPQFDFESQSDNYGLFKFSAKHGVMSAAQWMLPNGQELDLGLPKKGITIHTVNSWKDEVSNLAARSGHVQASSEQLAALGRALDRLLGSANPPH